MINLWYQNAYPEGVVRGPTKVISNTIRAFEDLKIPFAINEEKYQYNFFLPWDSYHIPIYNSLKNKDRSLIGPQIWPFSPEFSLLNEYGKVVVPSQWVGNLFSKYFNIEKLLVWPAPIYAPEVSNNISVDCLIYFKNRSQNDLNLVLDLLERRRYSHIQLDYGNYSQDQFKQALSSVRFCVIIDNTESQGIAIQEMMAANKPLFVWDQSIWDHMGSQYTVPASSVPYWSDDCGKKIQSLDELENSFDDFISNLNQYNPQKFVFENLSPEKSIQILLNHYEDV
jgi:hypothetical protein